MSERKTLLCRRSKETVPVSGLEADKGVDRRALTLPRHEEAVQLKGSLVKDITLLGGPEVILKITQSSHYGYAKLQYRFAVTFGSPSKLLFKSGQDLVTYYIK